MSPEEDQRTTFQKALMGSTLLNQREGTCKRVALPLQSRTRAFRLILEAREILVAKLWDSFKRRTSLLLVEPVPGKVASPTMDNSTLWVETPRRRSSLI